MTRERLRFDGGSRTSLVGVLFARNTRRNGSICDYGTSSAGRHNDGSSEARGAANSPTRNAASVRNARTFGPSSWSARRLSPDTSDSLFAIARWGDTCSPCGSSSPHSSRPQDRLARKVPTVANGRGSQHGSPRGAPLRGGSFLPYGLRGRLRLFSL